MRDDDSPVTFGSELRRRRRQRGLSLAALSSHVHYTKGYLSKVENGRREPTDDLAKLCDAVLDTGGELARLVPVRMRRSATAVRVVPRQLPAVAAGLIGRDQERARVVAALTAATRTTVAIVGPAGVGKTALAVQVAHEISPAFPDGTLFLNLHGNDAAEPVEPAQVLEELMRALGVATSAIADGAEARAAQLRTLLAHRRVLVVLDDARDSAQIRPLLPGAGHSAVLVTSRNRLRGVGARDGVTRLALSLLGEPDAVAILRYTVGAARVEAEPQAARDLVGHCAGLPLALRIIAERAGTTPDTSLRILAAQLAAEPERLDLLSTDDDATAVRSVLSWSYLGLPADAARAFRVLALHPGPELSRSAAAAMLGGSPASWSRPLDRLVDIHLLQEVVGGRFVFHDLVRVYANERAHLAEPDSDALRRVLVWYRHSAERAEIRIVPGVGREAPDPPPDCHPMTFSDRDEAMAWYDLERVNLVAAVAAAAGLREHELAWRLAAALSAYFLQAKRPQEWVATHEIGLAAARAQGDLTGQARMLSSLGSAAQDRGHSEESLEYLHEALAIRRQIGDLVAQSYTLCNMGHAVWQLGRHGAATEHYLEAVALARTTTERYALAVSLNNLGLLYIDIKRFDEAAATLEEALSTYREVGDRYGEGMVLDSLGTLHHRMGDLSAAVTHLRGAVVIREESGDRHGAAVTNANLGDVYRDAGRPAAARELWQLALATLDELGAPQADEVRQRLLQTATDS
jgi:tetratricopeptide (TPR) repeat protein/transcriptional regulator with XRE-family HTH domain